MANVPGRMPAGLITRDATKRQSVQVGRAVRAAEFADLEIATAYLAAGRQLAAPASLRYDLVGTSGATYRRRIATPIVPEYAWVVGMISSASYRTCTVRASAEEDGLTSWQSVSVTVGGGDASPFQFGPIQILVGAGSPQTPGYEEVHLQITNVSSGAASIRLHSWSVVPLPHVAPYSDGQI